MKRGAFFFFFFFSTAIDGDRERVRRYPFPSFLFLSPIYSGAARYGH